MKHILVALAACLPIALLADGGLPNQPYIYVEGRAEIEKPADVVTLNFDLVARAADQVKANGDVQIKATKVLALLNDRKIPPKDVIAEDFRSEPEYQQDENSQRNRTKLIGYIVTRPFSVKVRDVASFPKLVDDLIASEGAEFSGINASLSNAKEIEGQVWEKALADARERSEKTLKAIGMKIDSVFAVSPSAFPDIRGNIFGTERVLVTGSNIPTVREKVDPSQYRLAPVTVSQNVHVIYLISPAK